MPLVEVNGGADFSGHAYTWTFTNRHTSPLIHLVLPAHHVDLFTVPEGWTFQRDAARLVATAGSGAGIVMGRHATFDMRVQPKGAKRGHGDVTARFADGAEYIIRDVEVPVPETSAETLMPLFGLTLMLVVVIMAKQIRTRRNRRRVPNEHGAPDSIAKD